MTTLQFIASIIRSVAWPAAVVLAVWTFRFPLTRLLGELQRLTFRNFEASFERGLTEARAEIASDPATIPPLVDHSEVSSGDSLLRLAELAPRLVVDEAWNELQAAALSSRDATLPPLLDASVALAAAFPPGYPNGEAYEILKGLHRKATRQPGFEITPGDALEFVRLVRHLVAALTQRPEAGLGVS
jgi:hypothetical protein